MKLQFGKNQLVLELSKSPFAWFHVSQASGQGGNTCNWEKGPASASTCRAPC